MGANQSSSFQDLAKDYQEIQSVREKNLTLFKKRSTQDLFIVKEKVFNNKSEYELELRAYTKKQQTLQDCQNYLKLVRVWTQQHNGFCSNVFKIYPMYQYSSVTLQDQIEARKQQDQFFQQSQILSIIQSCLNAVSSQGPILVSPQQIFIASDGLLKLLNIQLSQQISKFLSTYNESTYYTPQKMEDFTSQKGHYKDFIMSQVIFSIGMTILHCIRLQNLFSLYNPLNHQKKKRFNKIQLEDILSQIQKQELVFHKEQYSEQLKQLLYGMLAPLYQNRFSIQQIQRRLNEIYQDKNQNNTSLEGQSSKKLNQNYLRKKSSHAIGEIGKNQLIQNKSNSNCFDNTQLEILKEINKNNNGNFSNYPISDFDISQKMPSSILQQQPYGNIPNQNQLLTDQAFLEAMRMDINQIKKQQSVRNSLLSSNFVSENKSSNSNAKYKNSVSTTCKQNFKETLSVTGSQIFGGRQCQNKISFGIQFPTSNAVTSVGTCRASQQMTRNSNQISESFPKKLSRNSSNLNPSAKKCIFVKQTYSNGSYYQGMKLERQNLKHGYGKMVFQDGAYYQGNYKMDKMDGKGVLFYESNRPAYDGFWKNDQFNGFGVLYNEYPEEMYELFDFINLQEIGQRWLSYQGNFIDDYKCGKGKITLTNGQYIEGEFVQDRLNGFGQCYLSDGRRICGYWKDNQIIKNGSII